MDLSSLQSSISIIEVWALIQFRAILPEISHLTTSSS
jgi:hypothetical protein